MATPGRAGRPVSPHWLQAPVLLPSLGQPGEPASPTPAAGWALVSNTEQAGSG